MNIVRRRARRLGDTVAIAALGVGVSCAGAGGDAAPRWLHPPTASGVAAARVARVVCGPHGARATSSTVRARPDGVHVRIVRRSRVGFFSLSSRTSSRVGRLEGSGATEVVAAAPPGALSVGCHVSNPPRGGDRARIEVVDPHGLWRPASLDCAASNGGSFVVGRVDDVAPPSASPAFVSWTQLVRAAVPGLRLTDLVIRPGYPETEFHSEPRTVYRDGRAVADLSIASEHGRWWVHVRACPASGIGFAPR
jgi:hypothetical protein